MLCADPATTKSLGFGRLKDLVQKIAYELDPQGTLQRIASAEKDRRVTIRPLPEGMARVSLLLPMAHGSAPTPHQRRPRARWSGSTKVVAGVV
ncbi:hypothetical protein [Tsukamurella sp. NPDC003166]|uniref:hypothetical protein n=1 Tax=Tsukamurella sp. NPDC003166 TaxID=3154444 RepID=UPI0033AEC6EA